MLKKTLGSVSALLMVLSATACSSGDAASSSSDAGGSSSETTSSSSASSDDGGSAAAGEEMNLRMIWWGSQTRHEYTQAAIDVFEEKNPGVTISPQMVSWDGYWQKLATQSASQDLPDII